MNYNKPPRTYAEQLDILEPRGLVVAHRAFALHCLEHCKEPQNHWAHRVLALLRAQQVPVTPRMGFPTDWETRPIWSNRAHHTVAATERAPNGGAYQGVAVVRPEIPLT